MTQAPRRDEPPMKKRLTLCLWAALSSIAAGPVPARAAETEDGKLASSNVYRGLADALTYGVLELVDAPAVQRSASV